MRKVLHAPKYSKKILRLPWKFHPRSRQNASLVMSTEIEKGEWRSRLHSHTFDEEILFQSNPIFLNGRVCQTSHISFTETYFIPRVSLPKQAKVHALWVSAISSRITHAHQVDRLEIDETFLAWKYHSGMAFDYLWCVNWGMTFSPQAWPFYLRMENTLF